MKKGIGGLGILLIALAAMLIFQAFFYSTYFRKEMIERRFLFETSALMKSDKIETYVRSFKSAVELSLLQACYDIKDNSDEIWQDCSHVSVPDNDIFIEEIKEKTENYANIYLSEYKKFANSKKAEINIPNSDLGEARIYWEDNSISTEFDEIGFEFKDEKINIIRNFIPSATLYTKLGKVLDLTNDFVENDPIGNKIRDSSFTESECTQTNVENKVQEVEEEFNTAHENEKIEINLEIQNIQVDWTKKTETRPVCSGTYDCDQLSTNECSLGSGCFLLSGGVCYPEYSCSGLSWGECGYDLCCFWDDVSRICREEYICYYAERRCIVPQGCTKSCTYQEEAGCAGGTHGCSEDAGCDVPGCTQTTEETETFSCSIKVEVKVEMDDISNKFPVYDGTKVTEDHLGLVYLVKTGNADVCN